MSTKQNTEYIEIPYMDVDEIENNCSEITNNNTKTISPNNNLIFKRSHSKTSKGCSVDVWAQRNINTQLLGAIYENDFKRVETCLLQGADPNSTCRTFIFTALHLAVSTASEQIILLLIRKGSRVDGIDKKGQTPLHYAVWHNRSSCIDILLNEFDKSERIEYINRKSNMQCPIVKEHLKDSLDHNCKSFEDELPNDIEPGSTALHVACQKIHHKCVEILLENHSNIDSKNERELTAFEVIGELMEKYDTEIEHNFIKILKLMLNNEAKIDTANNSNHYFTPVHAAVMLSSKEGINVLVKEANFSLNTWDHFGQTPIHLAIIKHLEVSLIALLDCIEDVSVFKNHVGITPFQAAVEKQWIQGVGLLLNANANIAEIATDGRTVLHVAATCGNVDLLEELLELEEAEQILDAQNNLGESPIYCAVSSGNVNCVKALLEKNADIDIKLNGNINILHRAAEIGNEEIITSLLKIEDEQKLNLIDELDSFQHSTMTPLHMAALNDKVECVKELLNWQCDYKKRTISGDYPGCTAIHLAAIRGNDEVVEALLEHDEELLWITNDKQQNPLHCAALKGQRKCIEVLLNAGADLSCLYEEETSLDIIYRNISRPTAFLESIFDKSIKIDDKNTLITDTHCMITIDFNILIPKNDSFNQMSILSNILFNGKGLEQRKLLLHPLIESFLYLKWNKMSKLFWALLLLYALFVCLLTTFVVSIFYYNDENRPFYLSNIEFLRFSLIISLFCVILPEVLLITQKLKQYTINTDRIIKWSSITLVIILVWVHPSNHEEIWLRHLGTISLITSWIEIMFMLSKLPTWGYYVQMFFKVSKNVIKVMTVFSFLVIGFALAFMIEFQATEPFTDPLSGFIKTIVMMTAELDYSGMFTGENKENAQFINLTIYVIFLMLGTIVLMNLLVGLAVSDIHNLELIGKIDRHSQQIVFLSMLESDTFARYLPNRLKLNLIKNKCVPCLLQIYPSRPTCNITKLLPQNLKESIIDIAEDNVNRDSDITNKQFAEKIDEMMKMIVELKNALLVKQ